MSKWQATRWLIGLLAVVWLVAQVSADQQQAHDTTRITTDRRVFAAELLKLLGEQHARKPPADNRELTISNKEDRTRLAAPSALSSLMSALSADGDLLRLTDWLQNSFNLASLGELTTQFVVSKLGSVNCAAIVRPDPEDSVRPRFLLFNEHFVDVPYELPAEPRAGDCLANDRLDPKRRTMLLVHGFLAGYTLVDGLTNIKNRLLDSNRQLDRMLVETLESTVGNRSHGSYVLTGDLEQKARSQKWNVIIVDWFNGANPVPRANYIRAAANARLVGRHIARFLLALNKECGQPTDRMELVAHSLGCHVAGFTGKEMQAAGQRLGKITHLDPIGLCFGRLFSEPQFRLSPEDARETQAVHVSLNLFDNPLDGAHSNFLVNGGRDQIGCGGQWELQNSTSSSVSLLFDQNARFIPCSHVRALSLYEDQPLSPAECQMVGYRCPSYDKFLQGKCGKCDNMNQQCRLMGLPANQLARPLSLNLPDSGEQHARGVAAVGRLEKLVRQHDNGSIAWLVDDRELNEKIAAAVAKLRPQLSVQQAASRRMDRRVSSDLIMQTLSRLRSGWSNLRSHEPDTRPTGPLIAEPLRPQPPDEGRTEDSSPATPIGSQPLPEGREPGPLYFLGTSSMSPYCVSYYQVRLVIAEARVNKLLGENKLAAGGLVGAVSSLLGGVNGHRLVDMTTPRGRQASISRELVHLTVKLTDSLGSFFKGFTLVESARLMPRSSAGELVGARGPAASESMVEMSLLLNSTRQEPIKVSEATISYYFHPILLADLVEVNYMSNISPQ